MIVAFQIISIKHILTVTSQESGGFLQTAQTWASAGVCSASCAHALSSMSVCFSLFVS